MSAVLFNRGGKDPALERIAYEVKTKLGLLSCPFLASEWPAGRFHAGNSPPMEPLARSFISVLNSSLRIQSEMK